MGDIVWDMWALPINKFEFLANFVCQAREKSYVGVFEHWRQPRWMNKNGQSKNYEEPNIEYSSIICIYFFPQTLQWYVVSSYEKCTRKCKICERWKTRSEQEKRKKNSTKILLEFKMAFFGVCVFRCGIVVVKSLWIIDLTAIKSKFSRSSHRLDMPTATSYCNRSMRIIFDWGERKS